MSTLGGNVYLIGGRLNGGISTDALATVQVFSEATGLWTSLAPLNTARYWLGSQRAVELPDGGVLVVGGQGVGGGTLSNAERYNPVTGLWSIAGTLPGSFAVSAIIRLPSGKVLVNGETAPPYRGILWNPATNTFAYTTGGMGRSSYSNNGCMAMLPNGKVLIVGGVSAICSIYDPTTDTFSDTGAMSAARVNHAVTALADGRVLAAGNSTSPASLTAEVYNYLTGTWALTNALTPKYGQGGTSPPGIAVGLGASNGKALLSGGYNENLGHTTTSTLNPTTLIWTDHDWGGRTSLYNRAITVLPSGKLLLFSGNSSDPMNVYIWNPADDSYTAANFPATAHYDQASVTGQDFTGGAGTAREPLTFQNNVATNLGTSDPLQAASVKSPSGSPLYFGNGTDMVSLQGPVAIQNLTTPTTPTAHAASHQGGADALAVDAVAGTGSLRTLGTGAQQACGGTDGRLSDNRTDANALHKAISGEITAMTEKTTPISTDLLVIEDSASSNVKKKVQIGNLPGGSGTDANAIHKNVAAEISTITEKTTPISADLILIEDSANSNAKKRVQIGNLPTGGGVATPVHQISDAGRTTSGSEIDEYTAITAARVVLGTIGGSLSSPLTVIIKDASGSASQTKTISFTPYDPNGGSPLVDGLATVIAISSPYGSQAFYCNGTNWFSI